MSLFRRPQNPEPSKPAAAQPALTTLWLRIPGSGSVQTAVLRNTPTELAVELPNTSVSFPSGTVEVIFEQAGAHWLLEAPIRRMDLSGRFPALLLDKEGARMERLPDRRRDDRHRIVLPLSLTVRKARVLRRDGVINALTSEMNGPCEVLLFTSRLPFSPGDTLKGELTLREGEPPLELSMELIRVDVGFHGNALQTCVARVKPLPQEQHARVCAFLESLAAPAESG